MLDYTILNLKKDMTIKSDVDGTDTTTIKDLLPSSINIKNVIHDYKLCKVNHYYIARPDLVSLAFYGTDLYADIICKINGISNPFELNEDMELIIPSIDEISNFTKIANKSSIVDDVDEIIKVEDKKNQKLISDKNRLSNEQTVGESNFIIDKTHHIVIY